MLLRLFRSLMPKESRFVALLGDHAARVDDGAIAFRDLIAGGDVVVQYQLIRRAEEAADDANAAIGRMVRESFITPFDRSDILALATAMDDTVDLMKDTARRLRLYAINFTPQMRAMAGCAARATAALRDGIPLLDAIPRHTVALDAMQATIRQAEAEADELLEEGLRTNFADPVSGDRQLVVERVYDLIEAIVDRCEDVADVVAGIVAEEL